MLLQARAPQINAFNATAITPLNSNNNFDCNCNCNANTNNNNKNNNKNRRRGICCAGCCWHWAWHCSGTLLAAVMLCCIFTGYANGSGSHVATNITSLHAAVGALECRSVVGAAPFAVGRRAKRFLTFSGGGVVKFVFGISVPMQLASKQRSVSMFYNVHIQYMPPPRPLYWWSRWNTTTFAARQHAKSAATATATAMDAMPQRDAGRDLLYSIIEAWLERVDGDGPACLLRAICSVSQVPFDEAVGGVYAALLNSVLIPPASRVSNRYREAHLAGRHNGDCESAYHACPPALSRWLRRVFYLL